MVRDVHLGTYGCRAQELLNYLRTVRPRTLVLNGDIIDIWQFNKNYFPPAHTKVIVHHLLAGIGHAGVLCDPEAHSDALHTKAHFREVQVMQVFIHFADQVAQHLACAS